MLAKHAYRKERVALCDVTRKEKLYAENISKIGEQSISGPAKSAIFKDSEKYRCFRSGKQEAGQSEKEGPLTSKQKLRGSSSPQFFRDCFTPV